MKPDAAKFCECKEPLLDSDCGFHPFCHRCGLAIKETPAAVEKDIEENLRLMNHGIIYQQPEKESWEERFEKRFEAPEWIRATLTEDSMPIASIRDIKSFIREILVETEARIAAQSEKKGSEARDKLLEDIAYAFSKLNLDNSRHGDCPYQDALIEINDLLERARSSEERKTNNK